MRLGSLATTALSAMGAVNAARLDIVPPLPLESDLGYEFGGSTILGRNAIRLTGDIRGERGWIVSRAGEQLPESFELELDFKIEGEAKLYGDGMALWFLDSPISEGTMMGLSEFYNGVAVVLDTYRNGKGGRLFPRLQILQNDGTTPYDKDNDGRDNELASCGLRGIHNNNRQDVTKLRLLYSGDSKHLSAEVNYRNKWETCFEANVNINPRARIALSAATGDLHEAHTITRLSVKSLGLNEKPYYATDMSQSSRTKSSKNYNIAPEPELTKPSFIRQFFRFVFRVILFVAVLYAIFLGFKTYKKYRLDREDERFKLS